MPLTLVPAEYHQLRTLEQIRHHARRHIVDIYPVKSEFDIRENRIRYLVVEVGDFDLNVFRWRDVVVRAAIILCEFVQKMRVDIVADAEDEDSDV